MSWNEEEMVREYPIANMTLDDILKILISNRMLNILLLREIINGIRVKENLIIVSMNNSIYSKITDEINTEVLELSDYYSNLEQYIKTYDYAVDCLEDITGARI